MPTRRECGAFRTHCASFADRWLRHTLRHRLRGMSSLRGWVSGSVDRSSHLSACRYRYLRRRGRSMLLQFRCWERFNSWFNACQPCAYGIGCSKALYWVRALRNGGKSWNKAATLSIASKVPPRLLYVRSYVRWSFRSWGSVCEPFDDAVGHCSPLMELQVLMVKVNS